MLMKEQYVASGKPAYDALAAERRDAYPAVLTPSPCHCCSKPTTSHDFWVCRWVYYFSKLGLLSLLSTLAGKVFVSTAKVPHATYHWLCADCARAAKAQRIKAGALQFIGLFTAIIGLIGTMIVLAALFAVPLAQRDRSTVVTWSWAPPALLLLGVVLTLASRRFRLPGVLGKLDRKPFVLEALFRSEPQKLEALQREFPDLYGLGSTAGAVDKPRTFSEEQAEIASRCTTPFSHGIRSPAASAVAFIASMVASG
jgi:hypothetical protein